MTSPNIHEYIKTTTVQPWPTASFLLLNLLGEICWNCSPRIDTSELGFQHVKDNGIDDLVLMQHGKCPVCGATRHDMVTTGRYSIPYIANIVLGQRSGKGILLSVLAHYYEHRIKHWMDSGLAGALPECFRTAGIELTPIYTTGSSLTSQRDVLRYIPFEYADTIDNTAEGSIMMVCVGRAPFWRSIPASSTFYSRTPLWLRAIDEAAWGLDDAGVSAVDMIQATSTRLSHTNTLQIRLDVFNGMKAIPDLLPVLSVFTGSPKRRGDIADVLEQMALFDNGVFHVRLPTWSFNPSVSIASLQPEFEHDAPAAWRDFGCSHMLPPASV
jgi:hypothetical protein